MRGRGVYFENRGMVTGLKSCNIDLGALGGKDTKVLDRGGGGGGGDTEKSGMGVNRMVWSGS